MIWGFALLALAWLVALYYCFECRGEVKRLTRSVKFWTHSADSSARGWTDARVERDAARTQCDTAMKQIADLKGQVPGRDRTGRFVKKAKECGSHGSE